MSAQRTHDESKPERHEPETVELRSVPWYTDVPSVSIFVIASGMVGYIVGTLLAAII